MGRLSTLLLEAVHVYFRIYSCRWCESSETSVRDTAGHGRAWQRVASLVEHATPRVLGVPLKLGRFSAIKCHWRSMMYWPTRDELTEWQLDDEKYSKYGG
jgi:hypothetical protein